VRLFTRNGHDWTERYPVIASAVGNLRCRSCLLDGEVTICGEDGIPVFDRLRFGRQIKAEAVLFVFDLLELDGQDRRREAPVPPRLAAPARIAARARGGSLPRDDQPRAFVRRR